MPGDWREPFFVVFAILAIVVGLLVWVRRPANEPASATFTAARSTTGPAPTAQPLPTAQPTSGPELTPSEVTLAYAPDAILLTGVVPAQPVADALIAAAAFLVGNDAVDAQLEVVDDPSLTGTRLVLQGEVADDAERQRVVAAFTGIGVQIDDRLVLAGANRSVVDVIAATADLSDMSDFMAASGVAQELDAAPGEVTLFAPTNAAMAALDIATLEALADLELLAEVLRFHVVDGARTAADLAGVDRITMRAGGDLPVQARADGSLGIGSATVVVRDLEAANGVVHVIDALQIPPTVATEIELNRLVGLDPVQFGVGSADILEASRPTLEQAAAILLADPSGRVEVQGHTDTDGEADVNQELSQRRADAVLEFLVVQGIDRARLTAVGYGETRLRVDPEVTPEDRASNRRIEFRVA